MYGLQNSELSTRLFQFSHKTRQTMLLYAYFTPKIDFKRKFNHHQSFLYDWRLTARTIRNYQYDSKSNRITKLRRSLLPYQPQHVADQLCDPLINTATTSSWAVSGADVMCYIKCYLLSFSAMLCPFVRPTVSIVYNTMVNDYSYRCNSFTFW